MRDEYSVGTISVAAIAHRLAAAGEALECAAPTMPITVDAGAVTGDILMLIAHVADVTGIAVNGLLTAADAVSACGEDYTSTDGRSADSLMGGR